MKVIKTKASDSATSSFIDLEVSLPKDVANEFKKDVGDFLVEKILESVADSKSPISGGSFKRGLSPEYKRYKESQGLDPVANLEFSGSMLDSLDYKINSKGIELGIFGDDAPKADGHNNFSGKSTLPERQFLPKEGDSFKSDIENEIEQMKNEYLVKANPLKEEDLKKIESEEDLWDILYDQYEDLSKSEIIDAVLGNDFMLDLLKEYGLLKYLNGK